LWREFRICGCRSHFQRCPHTLGLQHGDGVLLHRDQLHCISAGSSIRQKPDARPHSQSAKRAGACIDAKAKKYTYLNGERQESARINSCPAPPLWVPITRPRSPAAPLAMFAMPCRSTRPKVACSNSFSGSKTPQISALLAPVGEESPSGTLCPPPISPPSHSPLVFVCAKFGLPSPLTPAFSFPALPRCLPPAPCNHLPPQALLSSPPRSARKAGPEIAREACS